MARDYKYDSKPKPGVPKPGKPNTNMDISILKKALAANPKTTVSQFKKQLSTEDIKSKYPLNRGLGNTPKINPFGAAGVKSQLASKNIKKKK